MLANNNNQFDVLIGFLTSKFEELPDKIDSKEFISKFDALIGLQIDKNAIEKLKQFIEFCYNKMKDLRVSKENEINLQQKYYFHLYFLFPLLYLFLSKIVLDYIIFPYYFFDYYNY